MENMKIDNAQVTSSSVFGLHKPYYGRLNLLSFHGDPARSAWCANSKDKDPYLEVAFGQATTLSGVAIQGLSLFDNFVTSFRLCYGDDGKNFECVQEAENDKVSGILGIRIRLKTQLFYPFSKRSAPHENRKTAFSKSSTLETVFEKFRFR